MRAPGVSYLLNDVLLPNTASAPLAEVCPSVALAAVHDLRQPATTNVAIPVPISNVENESGATLPPQHFDISDSETSSLGSCSSSGSVEFVSCHYMRSELSMMACCKRKCLKTSFGAPSLEAASLSVLKQLNPNCSSTKKIAKGVRKHRNSFLTIAIACGLDQRKSILQKAAYTLPFLGSVCKVAFCAAIGIGKEKIKSYREHVLNSFSISPPPHAFEKYGKNAAIDTTTSSSVVEWLRVKQSEEGEEGAVLHAKARNN